MELKPRRPATHRPSKKLRGFSIRLRMMLQVMSQVSWQVHCLHEGKKIVDAIHNLIVYALLITPKMSINR